MSVSRQTLSVGPGEVTQTRQFHIVNIRQQNRGIKIGFRLPRNGEMVRSFAIPEVLNQGDDYRRIIWL